MAAASSHNEFCLFIILPRNPMAEKTSWCPPLSLSPCAPPLPYIPYRCGQFAVGCCVIPSSSSHRNPSPRRPLYYIFFFAPFFSRNDGQTSSPMRSARPHLLSNAPPTADRSRWEVRVTVTAAHLVSCAFVFEFCSVWRGDILHTCLVLKN